MRVRAEKWAAATGVVAGAFALAYATPSIAAAPDAPMSAPADPAGEALAGEALAGNAAPNPAGQPPSADAPVIATPALDNSSLAAASVGAAIPAADPLALALPQPAGPDSFVASFTGDVLPHSPLWKQAQTYAGGAGYDFAPMFAEVGPLVSRTDLGVCHLETPIAPEGENFTTAPLYGVPPEVVTALAASGFDRCSTASNHTIDRGMAGIERTANVLAAAGIGQVGMPVTAADLQPQITTVNGVRVAHLSYTYGYNGNRFPAGEEWRSLLIDPDRIVSESAAARAAGAQVVIVSLHWGTERVAAPTADQRAVADAVTASGQVDLIVGHHAHVLQPIEQVNGRWVIFGLGNVLSNLPVNNSWPAASQDAAIATVGFVVGADGTVTVNRPVITPTWVDKDGGYVIRDVVARLAVPAVSGPLRAALEASLTRTMSVLGPFVAGAPIA